MIWLNDLNKSNKAFVEIVWPNIKNLLHDGEIMPIEIMRDNEVARSLDVLAGIDFWQTIEGHGARGIASRVQFGSIDWGTFTIRKSRDSGARTEFDKRKEAIESDMFVYPHVTVHAYVDGDNLLSAGIAKTKNIFDAISKCDCIIRKTTNAYFYVIEFCDVIGSVVVKQKQKEKQ